MAAGGYDKGSIGGHTSSMVRIRLYSLTMSLPMLLWFGGSAWFLLAESEPTMALFIVAAGVFLQAFLGLVVACPRCGKSPYVIGRHWGPFALISWPVPDQICSKCSYDFRQGRVETD